MVPDVGTYYLDFAFHAEQVASEIDGRLHETDVDLFESDRLRQNALMLRGWLVLRFTWHMLDTDPGYVIATTRQALTLRRTNAGLNGLWGQTRRGWPAEALICRWIGEPTAGRQRLDSCAGPDRAS